MIRAVKPKNAALECFEHYRHVVQLVDQGHGGEGLSAIDHADIYLEQVKADNPEQHDTVMAMLASHYGISWQAIRRGSS